MNDEMYFKLFGVKPIHTRGTEEGVIFKYKEFFLKVYFSKGNFLIKGYEYGNELPAFVDEVAYDKITEYTKYLREKRDIK